MGGRHMVRTRAMRLLPTLCLTGLGMLLMFGTPGFSRGQFGHPGFVGVQLQTQGCGRTVSVARRSLVTPGALKAFLAKIDSSDYGISWAFKRRKFEAYGRTKLQDLPGEWYEKFMSELESGSIGQVELAGPDLADKVKKTIKSSPAKSEAWWSLMQLENGGTGTGDPARLPRDFVEQALAKL